MVQPEEDQDAVYAVIAGDVTLGCETENGRTVPLLQFTEGDVCGVVFQSPAIRAACFLQITGRSAILDRIPMSAIDDLNARNPAFHRAFQELLLNRLAGALAHVAALASLATDEHLRLHLAERAHLHPGHLVLDTEEELAAWLGVSRVHVAGLLRPLFRSGLIERRSTGRGIVVPDPSKLARGVRST